MTLLIPIIIFKQDLSALEDICGSFLSFGVLDPGLEKTPIVRIRTERFKQLVGMVLLCQWLPGLAELEETKRA